MLKQSGTTGTFANGVCVLAGEDQSAAAPQFDSKTRTARSALERGALRGVQSCPFIAPFPMVLKSPQAAIKCFVCSPGSVPMKLPNEAASAEKKERNAYAEIVRTDWRHRLS